MNEHDPVEPPSGQPERPTDPWSAALLAWHTKLIEGDPTGPEAIAAALLERLVRRLSARFPGVDPDAVSDAVTDALSDYVCQPQVFDLRKGASLEGFLARHAEHELRHWIRRRQCQTRREQNDDPRLLDTFPAPDPSPKDGILDEEERHRLLPELGRLIPGPADRRALQLWASGEWRTAVFAETWGLSDLSPLEQQDEVKRGKDRLSARLKRWAAKRGVTPQTLAALLACLARFSPE